MYGGATWRDAVLSHSGPAAVNMTWRGGALHAVQEDTAWILSPTAHTVSLRKRNSTELMHHANVKPLICYVPSKADSACFVTHRAVSLTSEFKIVSRYRAHVRVFRHPLPSCLWSGNVGESWVRWHIRSDELTLFQMLTTRDSSWKYLFTRWKMWRHIAPYLLYSEAAITASRSNYVSVSM